MSANVQNIRKWVDALRSGKYAQGTDGLRMVQADGTATFCCLGVACDIAPIGSVVLQSTGYTAFDGSTTELPQSVVEWLGVGNDNPDFAGRDAISWNDDHDASFAEIADLIEAEWLS